MSRDSYKNQHSYQYPPPYSHYPHNGAPAGLPNGYQVNSGPSANQGGYPINSGIHPANQGVYAANGGNIPTGQNGAGNGRPGDLFGPNGVPPAHANMTNHSGYGQSYNGGMSGYSYTNGSPSAHLHSGLRQRSVGSRGRSRGRVGRSVGQRKRRTIGEQGEMMDGMEDIMEGEEEEEEGEEEQHGFSNGKTILVLAIVVGCFAVLWPKIFYPMMFGSSDSEPRVADALGRRHPGTGPIMGTRPEPVRTVEKEWRDRGGPMPGMRPTIGGPGSVPQHHKASGGSMSLVMPIYTVAIIIFFVYTTMKIMFKNKKKDDEDEEEDDNKYFKDDPYSSHNPYYRYRDLSPEFSQSGPGKPASPAGPQPSHPSFQPQHVAQHVQPMPHHGQQMSNSNQAIPLHNLSMSQNNPQSPTTPVTSEDTDLQRRETSQGRPGDDDSQEVVPRKKSVGDHGTDQVNPRVEADLRPPADLRTPAHNQETEKIAPIGKAEVANNEKSNKKRPQSEVIDPRDLEIQELKKRLEETEKAMERIVQQLGAVTSRLSPNIVAQAMEGMAAALIEAQRNNSLDLSSDKANHQRPMPDHAIHNSEAVPSERKSQETNSNSNANKTLGAEGSSSTSTQSADETTSTSSGAPLGSTMPDSGSCQACEYENEPPSAGLYPPHPAVAGHGHEQALDGDEEDFSEELDEDDDDDEEIDDDEGSDDDEHNDHDEHIEE